MAQERTQSASSLARNRTLVEARRRELAVRQGEGDHLPRSSGSRNPEISSQQGSGSDGAAPPRRTRTLVSRSREGVFLLLQDAQIIGETCAEILQDTWRCCFFPTRCEYRLEYPSRGRRDDETILRRVLFSNIEKRVNTLTRVSFFLWLAF